MHPHTSSLIACVGGASLDRRARLSGPLRHGGRRAYLLLPARSQHRHEELVGVANRPGGGSFGAAPFSHLVPVLMVRNGL